MPPPPGVGVLPGVGDGLGLGVGDDPGLGDAVVPNGLSEDDGEAPGDGLVAGAAAWWPITPVWTRMPTVPPTAVIMAATPAIIEAVF